MFDFDEDDYDNLYDDEMDESIDSVADGLGFFIDDDNNWIPKEY